MSKGKKQKSRAAPVRRDAQGRAHLVIQRDEYGTPVGLALDRPLFNDRWQNEVALATASTAHAVLGEGHTLENAAALGLYRAMGFGQIGLRKNYYGHGVDALTMKLNT